jgi:hypothetical protein
MSDALTVSRAGGLRSALIRFFPRTRLKKTVRADAKIMGK